MEVNLPPLIETRVECPLSSLQTFWYRRLLLREYQTLLKKVETDEGGASASAAGDTDTQETGAWKKLQVPHCTLTSTRPLRALGLSI